MLEVTEKLVPIVNNTQQTSATMDSSFHISSTTNNEYQEELLHFAKKERKNEQS